MPLDGSLPSFDAYLKGGKAKLQAGADRANPRLRGAAAGYNAAQYANRQAFGRHLPQINLTGEYRHPSATSGIANDLDMWIVGVGMQVPLLDLSTTADTAAQAGRMDDALYREADTRQSVQSQIESLWTDHAQMAQSNSEISSRKRVVATAINRFKNDFGSPNKSATANLHCNRHKSALSKSASKAACPPCNCLWRRGCFKPQCYSLSFSRFKSQRHDRSPRDALSYVLRAGGASFLYRSRTHYGPDLCTFITQGKIIKPCP